jgi:enolase-phosphatase E1
LSAPLASRHPAAIVVDIEGTVGSITFVKDVLFPYARRRLANYVRQHRSEPAVARELKAVAEASGLPAEPLEPIIEQLERWSDEDRKATPLKSLQGMIWEGGYRSGELVAHLYDDAVAALRRWHAAGIPVYVYSSGSVPAQKLYFAHTAVGDLTQLLAGYFDTTTGPKQEPASYQRIAAEVRLPAAQLLFLSDTAAELRAATEAGWQAVQVRRDPPPAESFEPAVTTLDAVLG